MSTCEGVTMFSRVVPLLAGIVCILYQVLAQDTFNAELMIESNVTLESDMIISILNSTSELTVTDNANSSHSVSLSGSTLIAECLLVGDSNTCNCSQGYIWSNDVCYTEGCCRESTCNKNVTHYAPLCIPKVQVLFNGSVEGTSAWADSVNNTLSQAIDALNGLDFLNITIAGTLLEFVGGASVIPPTDKLEEIVESLETVLGAPLLMDTQGMVIMTAPEDVVCYLSKPKITCTFSETYDSVAWTLTRTNKYLQLSDGTVVKMNHSCGAEESQSCTEITLEKVTSIWAGTYTCGFMNGPITYKAQTFLKVAQLPDEIELTLKPLVADCSVMTSTTVEVNAIIPESLEDYNVSWNYNGESQLQTKSGGDEHVYTVLISVKCQDTTKSHVINITFENQKSQIKTAQVEIPALYAGGKFCEEEFVDDQHWPKTPYGATLFNHTCPEGRSGYRSRTCEGPKWQEPFFYCISEPLHTVLVAATNFLKGQGATPEVAVTIFGDLKNSTTFTSDNAANTADINASINIINTMALASETINLPAEVIPDLVDAASNMLNTSWSGVNETNQFDMSANYLEAVENLMKNIPANSSHSLTAENIDLKICTSGSCNVTVFDIDVSLNSSAEKPKIMALKNLTPKLENNYLQTESTPFLLSATLTHKKNNKRNISNISNVRNGPSSNDDFDASVTIHIDFPTSEYSEKTPICVFWNILTRSWSDEGCALSFNNDNGSVCHCNHLTSFSVLMSKGDISTYDLDIITNIGLGVSLCSLVVYLVIEYLVWSAVVKSNLSYFRHTSMVNIATFRLLADISFLASISPEILSNEVCLGLTMSKHLFYMAMFYWMLSLSAMLVHQLIFVFSPLRKRVFMYLSSLVGYLFPVVIVISSYVYYRFTSKPYYDEKTCWLVFERVLVGSVHAFLIPIGIVILANIFSMVVVIVTLVKTQVPDSGKVDDKETAKSIIKVLVLLAPIFGVTWVIGFFLLILDSTNPMFHAANYSFTILNSFQGLFILIAGCFAEQKVRDELIKIIRGKGKYTADNSTSTTYTKDK